MKKVSKSCPVCRVIKMALNVGENPLGNIEFNTFWLKLHSKILIYKILQLIVTHVLCYTK